METFRCWTSGYHSKYGADFRAVNATEAIRLYADWYRGYHLGDAYDSMDVECRSSSGLHIRCTVDVEFVPSFNIHPAEIVRGEE